MKELMKLLTELHNLHEAELPDAVNKIELADLVKHFPNNYKKAIAKLWGGPRLCWHDIPFFGPNDDDITAKAADAVKAWGKDGTITIDLSSVTGEIDGEDVDVEVNYDEPINPEEDGQEVYMGYDLTKDVLYAGYDVWHNEEYFNDEWDKAFKEATGEDFQIDNKEHYKLFEAAHKEFKDIKSWMLFELKLEGEEFTASVSSSGEGNFYPNGHTEAVDKGIMDLRVD